MLPTNNIFNKRLKHVLGTRIGARFMVLGLPLSMTVIRIAQLPQENKLTYMDFVFIIDVSGLLAI